MSRTAVTVNVHVQDETRFEANKVTNFVTLKVGADVDLFLMNSDQAIALQKAAMDAVEILKEMERPLLPDPVDHVLETLLKTEDMYEAGKAWIRSILGDDARDFSSMTGWTKDDWEVVMRRFSTATLVSQNDLDAFHAQFKGDYLRSAS